MVDHLPKPQTDEMCHEKFEHPASTSGSTVQDEWGPWTPHKAGDPCPIPAAKRDDYRVEFRDGTIPKIQDHAFDWSWDEDGPTTITHYRLRKPATPPDTLLRDALEALEPFERIAEMEGTEESNLKSVFVALGKLRAAAAILERARKAGVL